MIVTTEVLLLIVAIINEAKNSQKVIVIVLLLVIVAMTIRIWVIMIVNDDSNRERAQEDLRAKVLRVALELAPFDPFGPHGAFKSSHPVNSL